MTKKILSRAVIIICIIVQILSSIVGFLVLFNDVLEKLHEAGCASLNLLRFIFCVAGVCLPLVWGFAVLIAFDKAQKSNRLTLAANPSNKPKRRLRIAWPHIIKIEEVHENN